MRTGKNHTIITYKRAALVLSAVLLSGGMAVTGRLAPLADSVQDLEVQQEQAQKEADALEQARQELRDSLDSLDMELVGVSDDITALREEIEQTEAAIAETEASVAQAEEAAKQQYDSMKLRIQYMYENGGTLSWTVIFSAESFADVLNRVEYAVDLASADRRLLEEYKDTLQQIESGRAALEEKRVGLLAAEQQLNEKKAVLLASIETVQSDMDETEAQLAEKEAGLADIADQIAAMEEYERQLEEQKAKEAAAEQERIRAEEEEAQRKAEEEAKRKAEEEAARQEDNSRDGDAGGEEATTPDDTPADTPAESTSSAGDYYLHTTTPVTATAEEEELFAALIYCEAGGESYEGQLAVASVVVNRINSSRFPDNLVDVIYQKGQFSPAASGRLAVVLETGLTTESCRKAAREALGGTVCGDWLFFCSDFGTIEGTVIDSQVFY